MSSESHRSALDEESLSENSAAPIARLLAQAAKDIRRSDSFADITSMVNALSEAKELTISAPFNPPKEFQFLKRILDKAEA